MRTITFIILHCSATRSDRRYSFAQCRNDHINNNHWKDIGYHYYVERDGSVHQGRPESQVGAHVKNHNLHSIGICYEGGLRCDRISSKMTKNTSTTEVLCYAADTRTPEQKQSLRTLIEELHRKYPNAIILGHRDLSPDLDGNGNITPNEYIKQCPCFDAMLEYEDLQPEGLWK